MTLGEHIQFLPHAQLQSPESGCECLGVKLVMTGLSLSLSLSLSFSLSLPLSVVLPVAYSSPGLIAQIPNPQSKIDDILQAL